MKDIYFSHDVGAFSDPKMRKLRSKYGMEGYGIFWALVESLRREDSLMLDYDDEYLESLGFDFRTDINMREFVDDCIRWSLFATEDNSFFSETLIRRCEEANEKNAELSKKRRDAVNRRWSRARGDTTSDGDRDADTAAHDTNVIQNDTNEDGLYYKPIQGDTSKSKSKNKILEREKEKEKEKERDAVCDTNAPKNVVEYIKRAGVDMTPGLWEELRDFMNEGITTEMICMAVDAAAKGGALTWAYISKVITNWIVNDIRSVDDIKRERAAHERRIAERDKARFTAQAPPDVPEQKVKFL